MWVYTKHGQKRAELYGNYDRKAGEPAMCGSAPVDGRTARAWEKSGYIEWKEEESEAKKE